VHITSSQSTAHPPSLKSSAASRPPHTPSNPRGTKQQVRQVFDQHGAEAALTLGTELGLAPATLKSWVGEWRRAERRRKKEGDRTSNNTHPGRADHPALLRCADGIPVFNRLREGNGEALLYAFDLLELDGRDVRREPIDVRDQDTCVRLSFS
jgi:hypothetical protein